MNSFLIPLFAAKSEKVNKIAYYYYFQGKIKVACHWLKKEQLRLLGIDEIFRKYEHLYLSFNNWHVTYASYKNNQRI